MPTARWKREKEELRSVIEELKADNQPYQDELAFVKKVQSCADIARRDREMAEADTSVFSRKRNGCTRLSMADLSLLLLPSFVDFPVSLTVLAFRKSLFY